jgi:predicted transcriptional regulator
LKYYKIKEDIIEYAKNIIIDILPFNDLNKLCKVLNIVINLSYVDHKGICDSLKKYGLNTSVENQPREI